MRSNAQSRLAALSLLATGLAAVVFGLHRFEHGVWLIAYLLLVGCVAQFLLGRGQAAVSPGGLMRQVPVGLESGLWSAGVSLVPAGVLIGARLLVVVGGIALLAALTLFMRAAVAARPPHTWTATITWAGNLALIVFMALSVVVGAALAWQTPWL